MNSKKTILFVGEAVSLAHVSRPLVLAKCLDPEEYDIHFACDERFQSLISDFSHIKYWPISSIASKTFVKAADRGGYVLQQNDIESYVNQEMTLFRKVRPALIIGDFRYTLSISAELNNIPYATLANVHWSPYRVMEFDPVPKFPMVSVITKKIMAKFMPWKQQSTTASFNRVRRKYGLSLLKDYCDLATRGDYTLYVEPPGFIKTKPMPDHHQFMGPVLWSPDISRPSWWQTWDPKLPLIYITLGSTGVAKRLPDIVRALQKLPVTVVVATAGRAMLKSIPDNVYVSDYVPGLEVCGLASVVVCNGGSATAYQALSQGTPVVGIWSNIDQYLTMMTIERAGAGVCCGASSFNPQKILDIILTLLNVANCRAEASDIAERFRSYDACQRFRQFVLRTL